MNLVTKSGSPTPPSTATIHNEGSIDGSREGTDTPPPPPQYQQDHHKELSPANPAESFFLPTVSNSQISAAALASSLHSVHSARSRTGRSSVTSHRSTATEDFASACGDLSEHGEENLYDVQITRNNNSSSSSLFGRDILVFARQPIEEVEHEESTPPKKKMSYKAKSKKPPVIVGSTAPKPADDEPHFDVGTHAYEAVKGVWGWGKSVPLAGRVLGVYEAIGAKVVTTAVHKDLSTVDAEIRHHVTGLDKDVIDPAIAAILNIVFPAVEKGEEVLRPILMAIPGLKLLFPKMLTAESTDPETTPPSLEVN